MKAELEKAMNEAATKVATVGKDGERPIDLHTAVVGVTEINNIAYEVTLSVRRKTPYKAKGTEELTQDAPTRKVKK